jgi:hypothetical protein
MERDDAKKTPKIRYLSRREMLRLMGSTAAAITLAGCGGDEQSSSGDTTSASSAAETTRTTAETASGMLGVNVGVAAPMAFFPFNGIKDSFYGDLHATGKDGLRFFTENKVEITRWFSEPGSSPVVQRPVESGG